MIALPASDGVLVLNHVLGTAICGLRGGREGGRGGEGEIDRCMDTRGGSKEYNLAVQAWTVTQPPPVYL